MRLCVVCLVAATLLWPALAQAPGDREFGECGEDDHTYPPEWHVLFDTWNYEDLFDGGPLRVVNQDGGDGWVPGGGGSCREQLRICDYRQATQPQNNWVFTQFINFDEAREIYVNASYQYISCINNANRGCNTLQTTVYRYETNGQVSNAERVNPANYLSNEVVVLDLTADENSGRRIDTFGPSSSASGFYLGVQDTGTCGSIERITAYYRVCPGGQNGLLTIPEVPLPTMSSGGSVTKEATCAANSFNIASLIVTATTDACSTDAMCLCNTGFHSEVVQMMPELIKECQECAPGTYRTAMNNELDDSECSQCPVNSVAEVAGAALCECEEGFFRNDDGSEGITSSCTASPSAVQNYRSTNQSSTTITIAWSQPASLGGRGDTYYTIEIREQGSLSDFRMVDQESDTGVEDYTYTVLNLNPVTDYLIRVIAENGVSDQDPDTLDDRRVEIRAKTQEGLPGAIVVKVVEDAVLVWQRPEQPNGIITGYDVRTFPIDEDGNINGTETIEPFDPDQFFVVLKRNLNISIEVRANTSVGGGNWSDPVTASTGSSSIIVVIKEVFIDRNITIKETVEASSGIFGSDVTGYVIVAVICAAIGAIVTALVVVIVICCCRKRSTRKSKTITSELKNPYFQ